MRARAAIALTLALAAGTSAWAAEAVPGSRNKPERLEWFRDAAFGMFIHWSVDGQLGTVISHSLVGSTPDFAKRFFEDLPRTFNPRKFHPADWATLAKLAGMKYVVFTTKHHAGFCMWDTKTTDFDVMSTPFKRDITAELVKAFRDQGIAVGFYFSPDDFYWLHKNGKVMARAPHPGVTPQELPGLMEYDRAQMRELMTAYGPIDVVFIDGPAEGLRDVVWDVQPDSVVTRGAIETPEQRLAGVALDRAWESCVTMGTEWNYKAAYETYKSGTEMIDMLIETRAKGGNLLLNVGPKPDGELPLEQEDRLRQIAAWTFVNGEALYTVRPWVVTNEGDVWFTKKKGEDTVYAFLTKNRWTLGERKGFTLRSLKATDATRVSILGASGEVLEYKPEVDPRPTWKQEADGLHVSPMMSQRLYTNRQWYDPVVLKITNVKPALTPPVVATTGARRAAGAATATLQGELKDLGQAPSVEVGFQYRRKKGVEELYTADDKWVDTPLLARTTPGAYSAEISGLRPDQPYEFRAVVRHPLITLYGEDRTVEAKGTS